ncbi:hypothetical protein PTTG_09212 [Puccinia triticina 1-1 BBBD Race 1]|uniref:Uncharacterized protein n=1 Tax=Puccinia triticina (isolate 1-1 / race 1 (BBBD)) TaxID=630390 RepID=A0A180G1F5_PUCT1|nr:hypothetical protein PTTG_09212 [Puccinia triticina 1-1 BBBD Race 1]
MASPSNHSLLSKPSLPPNETAPDAQEDAGNVQEDSGNVQEDAGNVVATSPLDTLKGPAPSLEAYANFNSIAPPTLLCSERRQAGKKQCEQREANAPEDLIDLTNKADEEEEAGSFPEGSSASKSPPKRRRMADNKRLDQVTVPHQLPPDLSNPSLSLGQHNPKHPGAAGDVHQSPIGPTSNFAGEGADLPPFNPSSTAPNIPINQASPTLTAPNVNPNASNTSSTLQAGQKSPGPTGSSNQPNAHQPPPAFFFILKPASANDTNTNPTAPPGQTANSNPSTDPSTSTPQPCTTSLILDDAVRAQVHSILQTFQGNLNRQKFKQAHQAVHAFIDCRAQSMHKRTSPPALPQFCLFLIVGFSLKFDPLKFPFLTPVETLLLPANDEPWYAPGLINTSFKSANLANLKAEAHVEYPLYLLLLEIQKPSKFYLSRWSNVIASSIQLTAQQFAVKPTSLSNLNNNNLDSHLRILEYLNSCKTSALASISEDGKMRNDMTLKPLYPLHNTIIDIFITYSIIQGLAVADVEPDANSAESQSLVVQKKELDKHRSRHNYTPFCLYLVAGVRGLILAPHNRQFASGASALGFLSAVEHIFTKNIPQCKALEPVWKRLGAYIDGLFIASFLTPNCLFNFRQPDIIQLAQAITSDFLGSIQNQLPKKNFTIPRAVTAK